MPDETPIEKKVDDDWKRKVREEKEREAGPEGGDRASRGPLPEPNLLAFLSGLATQVLFALGDLERPDTGRKEADLEEARYLIDTLEMLRRKTEGNLGEDEARYFEEMLHELRMRYVQAAEGARPPAGS